MARTLESLVQDTLGAQALTILRLTAENDALHERIKELETAQADISALKAQVPEKREG